MDTISSGERYKYLDSLNSLKKRLLIGDNMNNEKKKLEFLFRLQSSGFSKNMNPAA